MYEVIGNRLKRFCLERILITFQRFYEIQYFHLKIPVYKLIE